MDLDVAKECSEVQVTYTYSKGLVSNIRVSNFAGEDVTFEYAQRGNTLTKEECWSDYEEMKARGPRLR